MSDTLRNALEELVAACEKDFESRDTSDCQDDESVGGGMEGDCAVTFGMIRRGRAALQPPAARADGPAPPKRIQRQRTKGWRMPNGCIYVGRPTKFGNPYRPMFSGDRPEMLMAVERFRFWLNGGHTPFGLPPQPIEIKRLRGHDLACFCRLDQPCHADVLLEIANAD